MVRRMKVLIVSDTHGRHGNYRKALEESGGFDVLIHLGDVEGGEDYIMASVNCEKHVIKGNNDFYSKLPKEDVFYLNGKKIFITHGHDYHVAFETERIERAGRERGADVVMFGHTHRPYLDVGDDVVLLNPGSLSYPRHDGRKGSYMMMEIDGEGKMTFEQRYVD